MNKKEEMRQLRQALMAFALTAPDDEAATFPSLYPKWRVGETVKEGERRYYEPDGKLYKVREGQGHTTQADWTPDITPALWAVIEVAASGAIDDPITASRGMEYVYGLYYTDPEDGLLYLCERSGEAAGGTVVLQYLPHELSGNYFTPAGG